MLYSNTALLAGDSRATTTSAATIRSPPNYEYLQTIDIAASRSACDNLDSIWRFYWYQAQTYDEPFLLYGTPTSVIANISAPKKRRRNPPSDGGIVPAFWWVFHCGPKQEETKTAAADGRPTDLMSPEATTNAAPPLDAARQPLVEARIQKNCRAKRSRNDSCIWVFRPRSNTQKTIVDEVLSNQKKELERPRDPVFPEETTADSLSPTAPTVDTNTAVRSVSDSDKEEIIPCRLPKEPNRVNWSSNDTSIKENSLKMLWSTLEGATNEARLGSKDDGNEAFDDILEENTYDMLRPPMEGAVATTASCSEGESDGEEEELENIPEEKTYAMLLPPMEGTGSEFYFESDYDEEEEVSVNSSEENTYAMLKPSTIGETESDAIEPTMVPPERGVTTVTYSGDEGCSDEDSSDELESSMEGTMGAKCQRIDDKDNEVFDKDEKENESNGEASGCVTINNSECDETWMRMYEELSVFRKGHSGSTDVPRNGRRHDLFEWCKNQRHLHRCGKLPKHRDKYLSDVGFDLNSTNNKHYAKWMEMYRQLTDYKKKHGTIHISTKDHKYSKLRYWTNKQRSYCKLKYRRDLMDKLGYNWTKRNDPWDRMYKRLVEYKRENGTTQVFENIDPELACWVSTQKKILLDTDKIFLLDEIDFEWPPIESEEKNIIELQWMEMYEKLMVFYSTFKHTRVQKEYDRDGKLSNWVEYQRSYCKNPTHVALLKNLEFEWVSPANAFWEDMFERLAAYKQKHGTFRVSRMIDNGLKTWVAAQRVWCKDPERIRRLNTVGFEWKEKNNKVKWTDMYERLVAYKSKHGTTFVSINDDQRLFTWVHNQRYQCKDPVRIGLLNEIDFEWKRGEKYREVSYE